MKVKFTGHVQQFSSELVQFEVFRGVWRVKFVASVSSVISSSGSRWETVNQRRFPKRGSGNAQNTNAHVWTGVCIIAPTRGSQDTVPTHTPHTPHAKRHARTDGRTEGRMGFNQVHMETRACRKVTKTTPREQDKVF